MKCALHSIPLLVAFKDDTDTGNSHHSAAQAVASMVRLAHLSMYVQQVADQPARLRACIVQVAHYGILRNLDTEGDDLVPAKDMGTCRQHCCLADQRQWLPWACLWMWTHI